MSSKSYIEHLLKSHGWETMSTKSLPDENFQLPKNAIPLYTILTHASAVSLNKSQVNREDGLPVQPVDDDNNNGTQINCNPPICHNLNTKISKPMCPFLTDYIEPMYSSEGLLENTTGHVLMEKKKGFNYCTFFGELMYVYITCRPDIGNVVTTLSKFSSAPTEYHYCLLKGVAIYLQNTIEWGI